MAAFWNHRSLLKCVPLFLTVRNISSCKTCVSIRIKNTGLQNSRNNGENGKALDSTLNIILKKSSERLNVQKTNVGIAAVTSISEKVNPVQETVPPNIKSVPRHSFRTDEKCEIEISTMLKTDWKKAMERLKYFDTANRYPSRETFFALIMSAHRELNLSSMLELIKIIKTVYSKEYEWEMGYKHYIAEHHWKMGKYKEAMDTFERLFEKNSKRRKKLSDMILFMARDIIDHASDDDIQLLIEFVTTLIKSHSSDHSATHVWYLLFISEKGSHHNLARTLFYEHGMRMAPFIMKKIDNILKISSEKLDIDCVQRLIECALFLQCTSEYSKIFTSLMEIQCLLGHVDGARSTLKYCNSEGIVLNVQVLQKYSKLKH